MEITVTQFKAKCLGIIEKVQREKEHVTISRHGKPAAAIVPIEEVARGTLFGRSASTTVIHGDIFEASEDWNAED